MQAVSTPLSRSSEQLRRNSILSISMFRMQSPSPKPLLRLTDSVLYRHPQLRHFISTVDQDWIYFASSCDIYALHLPSQRKYILVTLPFLPRCLVAGLGWICLGGEQNGDCAFIRLDKEQAETRSQGHPVSPPDSPRRTTRKILPGLGQNDTGSSSYPELFLQELGSKIVNSITLHELSNHGKSTWDEPVALLR